MTTVSVQVESLDELSLEGELDLPEDPMAAAVLCHPHPKMGGTMSAPLLLALRDELTKRGWAFFWARYPGLCRTVGDFLDGAVELRGRDAATRSTNPGRWTGPSANPLAGRPLCVAIVRCRR